MEGFTALLQALVPFALVLLGLIVAQLVLGIAVAVFVTKDFQVKKLPDFLAFYTPKVLAWVLIEMIPLIPQEVGAQIPGFVQLQALAGGGAKIIYGFVAAAALSGILGHLQAIGVIPGGLASGLTRIGMPSTAPNKPSGDGKPGAV